MILYFGIGAVGAEVGAEVGAVGVEVGAAVGVEVGGGVAGMTHAASVELVHSMPAFRIAFTQQFGVPPGRSPHTPPAQVPQLPAQHASPAGLI